MTITHHKHKLRSVILLAIGVVGLGTLTQCTNDEIQPALLPVSGVLLMDNGNTGNASDFEVSFTKQIEFDNIRAYNIFLVKESDYLNLTLETALNADPSSFATVVPEEIFAFVGKFLPADLKDINGNEVKEGESYRAGVLSYPSDLKERSHSMIIGDYALRLALNNQVSDYTCQLETTAGSIVLTSDQTIYMASYNIFTHLFESEDDRSRIIKINQQGSASEIGPTITLLGGNALDAEGNLYQSSFLDGDIYKITTDGSAELISLPKNIVYSADGIYISPDGDLYLADPEEGMIFKANESRDGIAERWEVKDSPRGLTMDDDGNLYVSHNSESGKITKITPNGTISDFAVVPTEYPFNYQLTFLMWVGYITYHEGFLYVPGTSLNKIYKIDMEGNVEHFAGSGIRRQPRGGAITANFNRPIGLTFSQDGSKLYVSGSPDSTPIHTQYSRPAQIWVIDLLE